jgi:hypothetical protein
MQSSRHVDQVHISAFGQCVGSNGRPRDRDFKITAITAIALVLVGAFIGTMYAKQAARSDPRTGSTIRISPHN